MRGSVPMRCVPVHVVIALGVCGLTALQAFALILVGGSDPMTDPGWPFGVLKVANLPSRVSWWEGPPFGGGQSHSPKVTIR